jgi:hypothetical protein
MSSSGKAGVSMSIFADSLRSWCLRIAGGRAGRRIDSMGYHEIRNLGYWDTADEYTCTGSYVTEEVQYKSYF